MLLKNHFSSSPTPYILPIHAFFTNFTLLICTLFFTLLTKSTQKMVKFSKEYESQLVPEWREAFLDYCQLKYELNKIKLLNSNNNSSKKQNNRIFGCSFISSLEKISLIGRKRTDHAVIHVLPLLFFLLNFQNKNKSPNYLVKMPH